MSAASSEDEESFESADEHDDHELRTGKKSIGKLSSEVVVVAATVDEQSKLVDNSSNPEQSHDKEAVSDACKGHSELDGSGTLGISAAATSEISKDKTGASVHVEECQDPRSALDKLAEDSAKQGSGWGWGSISSWGTSVLNTASASVTTFTSQVGEGFYQVLETVESGLGVPEPEQLVTADSSVADNDMSRIQDIPRSADDFSLPLTNSQSVPNKPVSTQPSATGSADVVVQPPKASDIDVDAETGGSSEGWLGGWALAGLSDVVHKTGSAVEKAVHQTTSVSKKVLDSGLDVLETIGKKTFDALAEGDHGLKQTLAKNRENRPNLSKALREAKEQAEATGKEQEEFAEARKSHYGAQFDDFQGLVQLEALEMLSSMSEGKVRGALEAPKDVLDSMKEDLDHIRNVFDSDSFGIDDEEDSDHDFAQLLANYVGQLCLNVSADRVLATQIKTRSWLDVCRKDNSAFTATEIHQKAIQSLAEFTACSIGLFHKLGQLILQDTATPVISYVRFTDSLFSLTKVLCTEIGLQSMYFTKCLHDSSSGADSTLITSVYLEASNSSTYVEDAFRLLHPVVQLAVVKSHPACQQATPT